MPGRGLGAFRGLSKRRDYGSCLLRLHERDVRRTTNAKASPDTNRASKMPRTNRLSGTVVGRQAEHSAHIGREQNDWQLVRGRPAAITLSDHCEAFGAETSSRTVTPSAASRLRRSSARRFSPRASAPSKDARSTARSAGALFVDLFMPLGGGVNRVDGECKRRHPRQVHYQAYRKSSVNQRCQPLQSSHRCDPLEWSASLLLLRAPTSPGSPSNCAALGEKRRRLWRTPTSRGLDHRH